MIRFHWKSQKDGRDLCKIGVQWTLDRNDLARLLLKQQMPYDEDGCVELTSHQVESLIRAQLTVSRDAANWVSDDYGDMRSDGLSYNAAYEWALTQVSKL